MRAIDRLFPQEMGEEAGEAEAADAGAELARRTWQLIPVGSTGYIQAVDAEGLVRFAREHDCIVRMEWGLGAFVVKHSPLVSIAWQGGGALDEAMVQKLNEVFTINHYRTIEQDAAFGIRQIVDVALKALSPGVNDTTTAIVCIDYLGAILAELVRRRVEKRYRSEAGEVQVIARGATFESLVHEAFDQIRDAAAGNTSIYLRLLGAIETVAQRIVNRERGATLVAQVKLIAEEAERTLASDYNLDRVRAKVAAVRSVIESKAEVQSFSQARVFGDRIDD